MNEIEIQALINLLDDPDTEIFHSVSQKLLDQGIKIIPELEKARGNSFNKLFQERIENIIRKIQFQTTLKKFSEWTHCVTNDLLEGSFWVAKYQYPDLELTELQYHIDKIVKDIWLELNDNLTALEKIKILNHIIFNVHGFTKNLSNFYSPRNSYINQVLETKKGNPLSLSIIYVIVAQQLCLPVFGVNLPKNFILAYQNELQPKSPEDYEEANILFYINTNNNGAVLGKQEIDYFIEQLNIEPQKSFYIPCSNIEIIQRLILNLIFSYEKSGSSEKVKDLKNLLTVVKH